MPRARKNSPPSAEYYRDRYHRTRADTGVAAVEWHPYAQLVRQDTGWAITTVEDKPATYTVNKIGYRKFLLVSPQDHKWITQSLREARERVIRMHFPVEFALVMKRHRPADLHPLKAIQAVLDKAKPNEESLHSSLQEIIQVAKEALADD